MVRYMFWASFLRAIVTANAVTVTLLNPERLLGAHWLDYLHYNDYLSGRYFKHLPERADEALV